MSISIERGVIPPFAAPGGVAVVGWIVAVENDETGAIDVIGAATSHAEAKSIVDGWIDETGR